MDINEAIKILAHEKRRQEQTPVYRIFVNNGHGGCYDIVSLDELEFVASEALRVMTPSGQESAVTLRVIRLKEAP